MAGALRQALERTARLREPPLVTCAGRTDAGVHARGQVAHVDLPPIAYDGPGLARALNRQLAPKVVVLHAEAVGSDFDARRSATGRTLPLPGVERAGPRPVARPRGLVRARPARPGLHADRADVLLGTHDFRSFCRRRPGTDVRGADRAPGDPARWSVDQGPEATDAGGGAETAAGLGSGVGPGGGGRLLRFEIVARSFCHQMVRSVVASLVEVGRGRENAAGLMEQLRATTRHRMPDPGPGPRAVPGLGGLRPAGRRPAWRRHPSAEPPPG